ncbi:hypothetical protein EV183_002524 [Coemansia sp. RSA 2336]|nr:hypothetical protein EV183_002524 [Coemansia sp. RSA 2336]
MPEAALAEKMVGDQIARRKRKLDFDEQPPTKKPHGLSQSRTTCLGKRKQPVCRTEKPKRPRVSTADDSLQDEHKRCEDVFTNLSVIEMPLSIRAQAYLQDPAERPKPRQTLEQKEAKVDEGYGSNALVLYSPPTLPYVPEPTQMDLD